jgi:uncharacterized protein (TIGR02996 family)
MEGLASWVRDDKLVQLAQPDRRRRPAPRIALPWLPFTRSSRYYRVVKLRDIVALWRETLAPEAALAAYNAASTMPHATWPEGSKALHAEWIKRAKKPEDEAIVELMRVSDFAKHTANQLLERLGLMETWEPHPITTRWLVDVFARQTRAPLLAGQKCFRRVLSLLIDHIDKAGAERFESWIGTHVERIAASAFAAEFFDDGIKRVLAKSAERRAEARAVTKKERAALEKAGLLVEPQASPSEVTIDSLYAAIYEAPWDDGPRLVLADFLQQQSDPRGELITLDLLPDPTPEQTKRRNELLKKHGKAWFPDELNRLVKKSAEYERGFLAFGELLTVERTAIELATFRELQVIQHQGAVPQFDHAAFRGVESWFGVDIPGVRPKRWLDHAPVPRVRRLGISMRMDLKPDKLLELIRPDAWPNLTEIVIDVTIGFGWDYGNDHAPAMFSELPRVLGAHMPQVMHIDIRPFARFDRDGRILTEVFLPSSIAGDLSSDAHHQYQADTRRRWIGWLRALGVRVVVEAPAHLEALGRRLGVEVRLGTGSVTTT